MKTIEVAAAVIVDSFENTTAVFATEKEDMVSSRTMGIPRGKIEVSETHTAGINKRNSRRTYSKNQSG